MGMLDTHTRGTKAISRRIGAFARRKSAQPTRKAQDMKSNTIPGTPQFITYEALNIRYVRSEIAGKDTALLLSPWPESLYAFAPVWPYLAEAFSLVAVDLPGFGQSEGRPELMSPRAMGDFVVGLAATLGLERPHAIGPDVGTAALLFAAAEHPEAFASIVIGAGSSTYPVIAEGVLKAFIDAPSVEDFREIDSEEVINGVADGFSNYAIPGSVRDDYIESYADGRLFDSIAYVREYPNDLAALAPLLAGIKMPVQIIVGKDDDYGLAADGVRLNQELSKSKLDILGSRHCVWEEEPAQYGAIIADWIETSHLSA
jgi:pimeloyl-ACP methyl ester carboxylesterase